LPKKKNATVATIVAIYSESNYDLRRMLATALVHIHQTEACKTLILKKPKERKASPLLGTISFLKKWPEITNT